MQKAGTWFALLFAMASAASAQPATTPRTAASSTREHGLFGVCSASADPEAKRPAKAFLCSLGFTAGPVAGGVLLLAIPFVTPEEWLPVTSLVLIPGPVLVAGGLLIGPSMGNLYAHDTRRGHAGIGIRVAGTGIVLVATVAILVNAMGHAAGKLFVPFSEEEFTYWKGWDMLTLGGTALIASGALWNIASAPISARQYNERQLLRVSVRPHADLLGRSAGLTLSARF